MGNQSDICEWVRIPVNPTPGSVFDPTPRSAPKRPLRSWITARWVEATISQGFCLVNA